MVTYGLPLDVSPTEAILDEVRWTAGHVAWLRAVVQSIEPDALTWGRAKRKSEGVAALDVAVTDAGADLDLVPSIGTEVTEAAAVNVWLKLYLEERKHLVEVAATAVRIGIEERRVRLAEDQGQLLVAGLQWLVGELRLRGKALERAHDLIGQMLTALAAGQVPALPGGEG